MKTRESGMPEESLWETFFQPEEALDRLGLKECAGDVVEFGCGYGTFTIPAARRTSGAVYTFDIEPDLVALTSRKAQLLRLSNVQANVRDFVAAGTGLHDHSGAYVMLFNILHAEQSDLLLREARRVLRSDGLLGVMHWNYDPQTPRGPSLKIRPRPEQCCELVRRAGFEVGEMVNLPPYHYGFVAIPSRQSARN